MRIYALSVIVFVVHPLYIAVNEAERDTPIGLYDDRPVAFALSFQFVQSETGDIHISKGLGLIELGENETEPLGMDGLNLRRTPLPKEQFQPLVREGLNHCADCNRHGYARQLRQLSRLSPLLL